MSDQAKDTVEVRGSPVFSSVQQIRFRPAVGFLAPTRHLLEVSGI